MVSNEDLSGFGLNFNAGLLFHPTENLEIQLEYKPHFIGWQTLEYSDGTQIDISESMSRLSMGLNYKF